MFEGGAFQFNRAGLSCNLAYNSFNEAERRRAADDGPVPGLKAMGLPPLAPLVVGVTGHRDLRDQDRGRLRGLVGRELDRLLAGASATPLMILSPLADGADRLVAREGLDRGARLTVLLPMDQRSYEEDFETEESLLEFRELLGKAETVVTLPPAEGRSRQYAYALVGACVARHSQVLLALWDGLPAGGTGGTAQIVDFELSGRLEETALQHAFQQLDDPFGPGVDPLAAPEPRLVIHIVTPRRQRPMPDAAFEVRALLPESTKRKPFFEAAAAARKRLAAFNEDVERLWRERPRLSTLLAADHARQLPESLSRLLDQQAAADELALRFQRRTKHAVLQLGVAVFLAATAFAIHSTLLPEEARRNPGWLALYLGLLASAAGIHAVAERRNLHNKFLDYRAVAEGLRVQFFWRLGGRKTLAADHYLRWQRSELEWIRLVLRAWALPLYGADSLPQDADAMVWRHWIDHQAGYFKRKEPEKRNLLLRLTSIRNVLILLSLAVAAFEVFHQPCSAWWARPLVIAAAGGAVVLIGQGLWELWLKIRWKPDAKECRLSVVRGTLDAIESFLGFAVLLGGLWSWAAWERVDPLRLDLTPDVWRMLIMGLAAVAAALIYTYADTMALSDEAKQYERMGAIFSTALSKENAEPGLLDALGKEALAENGEWVLMHRERPVEMPHA